jgi:hypothetical protein
MEAIRARIIPAKEEYRTLFLKLDEIRSTRPMRYGLDATFCTLAKEDESAFCRALTKAGKEFGMPAVYQHLEDNPDRILIAVRHERGILPTPGIHLCILHMVRVRENPGKHGHAVSIDVELV